MNPDLLKDQEREVLSLAILLTVMDILLEESVQELDFTQLAPSMNPDLPRDLVREVLMLSQDIIHRTTGHPLLLLTDTPLAMDVVVRGVLNLDTLVMDMDIPLELSAPELVFTQQVPYMNPDLPRDLVREVLMLSQDIIHRTTGHLLLLLMDTPLAM